MLEYQHVSDLVERAAKHLVDPPRGIMLPWWPQFNFLTGGLRPSELTLLCAPTGAGKTQLLSNVSAQLFAQGIPQFVAPVETGDTDFLIRVLSCLEKRNFNTGDPHPIEDIRELMLKYDAFLKKKPLYIAKYENRVASEDMVNMLKYQHQEHGVRIAVLDNLNFFLKVSTAANQLIEMDTAVHEFVMLVKKLPIHVILVVHPRKTEGGRVESEFDIKGSSTAVQECANVCLFNRPTAKDIESGKWLITDRELVFRKLRLRGVNINKPMYFSFLNGRYHEQDRKI